MIMIQYAIIDPNGYIESTRMEDLSYEAPDGYRFLPMNIPIAGVDFTPLLQGIRAVLPVPADATEVSFEIVELGAEYAANAVRTMRDEKIAAVEWRVARYLRNERLGLSQVDSIEVLDAYIQALADLPEQEGFPSHVVWPVLE